MQVFTIMSTKLMLEKRLAERDALVAQIINLLQADDRIVAAWLFGSLGDDTADNLSDIDLWIAVADEHIEEISKSRRENVAMLGNPLLIQEAPQNAPAGGAYTLVLYSGEGGPQQVDWYWQAQSQAHIPLDTRLLFDRVGIPLRQREAPTREELAKTVTNQVAFFWAMSNIAAKKIARHQSWGALNMLGLLNYALEETEWLVGLSRERPGFKDTRTELPPVQPAEQMVSLREMAKRMEGLALYVEEMGGAVPTEVVPHVYRFFNLVDESIADSSMR